jgi:hypothetical protein
VIVNIYVYCICYTNGDDVYKKLIFFSEKYTATYMPITKLNVRAVLLTTTEDTFFNYSAPRIIFQQYLRVIGVSSIVKNSLNP